MQSSQIVPILTHNSSKEKTTEKVRTKKKKEKTTN